MKTENNKGIEKVDFETYLWDCFTQFINKEGNYIRVGGGKRLKDGLEYNVTDVRNRNPMQVSKKMWKEVVIRHLLHFTYN